ncbi:hypothetical protein HY968_00410 [Candidatus Kaiserbacteria bacterium]|nr:hypothetical protein [Candidatus Kaiserbacteria bacterium]
MRTERAILIAFFGNYLINNVVAAVVALLGLGGNATLQYVVYFVLAAAAVIIFTWWYLKGGDKGNAMKDAAIFAGVAFLTAVVTAFVSGISGVLTQTGSFSQLVAVLPNFWPFLWNWSTLALLAYWIVPAALAGWWLQRGAKPAMSSAAPRPMV